MSDASWEKRPKEGPKAYAAFIIYRDQGPQRSLSKVARALSKSVPLIKRWSRAWRWQARVIAWDAHLCKIADDTKRAAVADACDRHTKLAKAIQGKLAARLMQIEEDDLKLVSLGDVGRLLEVAVKVERLGLGMPTSNHHHEGKDGGPLQVEVLQGAKRRLRDKLGPVAEEAAAEGEAIEAALAAPSASTEVEEGEDAPMESP